MVESKLVELVVAGSNPVGHPTSNLVVWPRCNLAPRDFMPDALVDVIQENFREQFHAADVKCPLQFSVTRKVMMSVSMLPVMRHETALARLR